MSDPIIEEIKQLNRETAALMKEGKEEMKEWRKIMEDNAKESAQDMKELRRIMEEGAQDVNETRKIMKEAAKDIKDLGKIVKEFSKQFGRYTKNEADGIEDETNRMLIKFLLATFPEYNIFKLDGWKTLQSPMIEDRKLSRNERSITEFDGLYVVSKDNDIYFLNSSLVSGDFQKNSNGDTTKHFLILEAKHALTTALVDNKIKQMIEFQKYMELSYDPDKHTMEFRETLKDYKLSQFVGKHIYLFFASPLITMDTQNHIINNAQSWYKQGLIVGFMVPEGNRYGSIKWAGPDGTMLDKRLTVTGELVITRKGGKKKSKKKAMTRPASAKEKKKSKCIKPCESA